MTRLPFSRPEELPCTFGRYQVLKLLGQGSMGRVYLAQDLQLDRLVALKIPNLEGEAAPKILKRFTREARLAATIMHPNVCPVHDVGEIDGVPYLTMGYIDGKPLSAFIGDKPLPQRQIAKLLRKLALALAEAHKRGVIHRDLKPSNIMIDKRSEPFVMDFGLARRHQGDVLLTQRGTTVGTPAYMSPEQISGDLEAMGPPSDIYSLGVILYELLTGQRPFKGDLMAMLSQVLMDEPPPPSTWRPDVDPQLEAICRKTMAKKAADRYGSMTELATALQDYLRGAPATEPSFPLLGPSPPTATSEAETQVEVPNLRPAELVVKIRPNVSAVVPEEPAVAGALWSDFENIPQRAPRQRKYRRGQRFPLWVWIVGAIITIGAAGAAAVLVLAMLAIYKTIPTKTPPDQPIVATSDYGTIQLEPSDPAAPDLDLKVDGNAGHRWGDALRLRVGEHELEGSFKGNVLVREKFTVQPGDNPIHRVALAKQVPMPEPVAVEKANLLLDANRGRPTDIFLMNSDGSDPVNLTTKALNPCASPTWSPDGKQIVFSSGAGNICHLYVMNVEDRTVKQLTNGPRADLFPSWSIDGKIAFCSTSVQVPNSAIFVMNPDGLTPPTRLTLDNVTALCPAWSPDGKKIAFISLRAGRKGYRLAVMDADGRNAQEISPGDVPSRQVPAWSPDGQKIAYVEGNDKDNSEIIIIDRDGSHRTPLTHVGEVNTNPAWKPDGQQLAFVHNASTLYLINADGTGLKEILKDQVLLGRPAWKPRR